MLWACSPSTALSQTPSPLQEWQYSSGIVLERLFEPDLPDWRVVLGAGAEAKPLYDGAELSRVQGGPVINIRYNDIAFVSVGEGVGVNVLRGENYRAGVVLGYDLGRRVEDDYGHLHGLGDIGRAPAVKLFVSYAISKEFPMVLRGDVRQIIGGAIRSDPGPSIGLRISGLRSPCRHKRRGIRFQCDLVHDGSLANQYGYRRGPATGKREGKPDHAENRARRTCAIVRIYLVVARGHEFPVGMAGPPRPVFIPPAPIRLKPIRIKRSQGNTAVAFVDVGCLECNPATHAMP